VTDLTIKEAYLAMYQFMATIIDRDGNESFLDMISGMSFLWDGGTADAGMWYLWEQAIKRIKKELTDHLTVEEAHEAMGSFLEHWNSMGQPEEGLTRILSRMKPYPSVSRERTSGPTGWTLCKLQRRMRLMPHSDWRSSGPESHVPQAALRVSERLRAGSEAGKATSLILLRPCGALVAEEGFEPPTQGL